MYRWFKLHLTPKDGILQISGKWSLLTCPRKIFCTRLLAKYALQIGYLNTCGLKTVSPTEEAKLFLDSTPKVLPTTNFQRHLTNSLLYLGKNVFEEPYYVYYKVTATMLIITKNIVYNMFKDFLFRIV